MGFSQNELVHFWCLAVVSPEDSKSVEIPDRNPAAALESGPPSRASLRRRSTSDANRLVTAGVMLISLWLPHPLQAPCLKIGTSTDSGQLSGADLGSQVQANTSDKRSLRASRPSFFSVGGSSSGQEAR
ncbi:hypothetical protein CSKR_201999 [Clonorchis sinensis]|uniref:Uncharacterized protein n=1 Tax=Clonorchis sinensis TaxID=79923 RepID=A0A8T1MYD9_CLOSI|nr:hypothetical protein CSKR_201999 [Clonorchis sinensis]